MRALVVAALGLASSPALAQIGKRNPFSLGVDEGSVGDVGRIGLWLLHQQADFYKTLRTGVEAALHDPSALLSLAAAAFAYGVFHAAGPGHGKAVISSYMLANERAMKRGIALSFLSAGWQALVAIALVGVASLLLGATAQTMTAATSLVEKTAYALIAGFGGWLLWRKGAALVAALRPPPPPSRFKCDDGGESHPADCPHCVAPDPKGLAGELSWRQGAATVLAAGSRPCSGAILVLVFSAALGAFRIGVWATLAMAAGTALTTAGLAAGAVLFKSAMTRLLGAKSRRAEIFARAVEAGAALAVLLLGLSLLAGVWVSGG
ncbi:ABC-type nickel/cobalt efflux system permease component RcnA [Rhodoblastus acidophilus]|uniref:nickel/cobalt transporter n=1 Tax=Rhodoblastus acidophilus TaxID=1074 RepID=UPI0022257929|nr:nickel/cobalt transporter [Rhodoblastus acidophilus]MCW2285033.1 ABC-type nickel/cobalt efflux system permease component RcnA [Rhodoblastus acidophilus]MCW2333903.1 ABC-type nickel/cobalt efflux system permease component RcnA [Rhodoblastus acidophilus]